MKKKLISICIPVFNEAQNIPIAISSVETLFNEELTNYDYEIVVTDNSSTDNSWAILTSIAQSKSCVKAFRFSRNFGYQNSIFAGLTLALGDAVVELDADLEDPPQIIVSFVKKWEEGFDVAYGVRKTRHASFLLKLLFKSFYRILNKLSEIDIPENSGDFRLLDRKVVDVLKNLPERNLYLRGLVSYLGFRQCAIYYDRDPRLSGKSKFRLFHYFAMAIDALTAFTKFPLRLIGVIGAIIFIASLFASLFYAVLYFRGDNDVKGFTTLVILTLLLHSITFIFLGIIGEYLSRIFDDSKYRPRVIIMDSLNSDTKVTTL